MQQLHAIVMFDLCFYLFHKPHIHIRIDYLLIDSYTVAPQLPVTY